MIDVGYRFEFDGASEIPRLEFLQNGVSQAQFTVYDAASESDVTISPRTNDILLLPGSYDVAYRSGYVSEYNIGTELWPRNEWSELTTLDVTSGGSYSINVPAVAASFDTTLNGATPPVIDVGYRFEFDGASEIPRLEFLQNGVSQAQFTVYDAALESDVTISPRTNNILLIPGSYDVAYRSGYVSEYNIGTELWPRNEWVDIAYCLQFGG